MVAVNYWNQIKGSMKVRIRQEMQFKMNFFILLLGIPIKIAVIWLLWDFVLQDNDKLKILNREQIFIFVALNIFLEELYNYTSEAIIMESELVYGSAVVKLTLPIEYNNLKLFEIWGMQILISAIGVITALVLLYFNVLSIKINYLELILFVLSIILAIWASFLFTSLIASLSVIIGWVSDLKWVIFQTLTFLGGSIIPIAIFPKRLQFLKYINPFANFFDLPSSIFIANILSIQQIIIRLVISGIWVIVLYILHNKLWRHSLERFTAPGE